MRVVLSLLLLVMSPSFVFAEGAVLTKARVGAGDIQTLKHSVAEGQGKLREMSTQEKHLIRQKGDISRKLVETSNLAKRLNLQVQSVDSELELVRLKRDGIEEKLRDNNFQTSQILTLLMRVERTPPEAVMLSEEHGPYETAQASLLLGRLVPYLERYAQDYRDNLAEYIEIEKTIAVRGHELKALLEERLGRQEELRGLVAARKVLLKQKRAEIRSQEIVVRELAERAKTIEDLLAKVESGKKARRIRDLVAITKTFDQNEEKKTPQKTVSIKVREAVGRVTNVKTSRKRYSGLGMVPVQGAIRLKYGQKDVYDAKSEGIKIEAIGDNIVVAPLDGVVRYTGVFRNYDNLVIVEHNGGYHSLVAGLGQIDVVVGQRVLLGEPIGAVGDTALPGLPSVYYELRRDGKTLSPAKKIGGIGS